MKNNLELIKNNKQFILSAIHNVAKAILEQQVEDGELEAVWNEDIDDMEWNMIEDCHYAWLEILSHVLECDEDEVFELVSEEEVNNVLFA